MTADDPIRPVEEFLRQAVFRSRELQATRGPGMAADGSGLCGLGEKAALALDLGPQARELFRQLWPDDLDQRGLERVREIMQDWVREQDAFDRQRNHFLKAFRRANGTDRNAWSPEQVREYESGLESINGEANARQRAAAERLQAIG